MAQSKSGTCIAAYLNLREPSNGPHIGLVNFYFEHTIQCNSMGHTENSTQTMSLVQWFKVHPDRDLIQHPLGIWEDSFMPLCGHSLLPVKSFLYPVAFTKDKLNTSLGYETVIVTISIYHFANSMS